MRFLIVRTEVRTKAPDDVTDAWALGGHVRDERSDPEQRRQTVSADDWGAAMHLARALSSVGAVKAGRQRVKVVRIGDPPRRSVTRDSRSRETMPRDVPG
ncbi:MAG TPA: hypothetical protein VGJ63_23965 [Micromonosporaceae bacterium]|jgi:hypothetical protein